MIDANDLAGAFARNVYVVKAQSEGLSHEDSLIQVPFGNCLNWVLGHIVASRDEALHVMGEPLGAGALVERYKRGSAAITGECEDALPLAELLTLLDRSQEHVEAALSRMDAAAFARKSTDDERGRSIGQLVFFRYFHETFHVGQTELFRQLAGKDDKLI